MAGLDDRQIARWRLASQRLVGDPCGAPAGVVRGLLGVQAENLARAGWVVAGRTTPPRRRCGGCSNRPAPPGD